MIEIYYVTPTRVHFQHVQLSLSWKLLGKKWPNCKENIKFVQEIKREREKESVFVRERLER